MKTIFTIIIFSVCLSLFASEKGPWQYISDYDFGIRNDSYGRGDFVAPRGGGGKRAHTGIDFLFDVETHLYAPCTGIARWEYDRIFGYSVDLVCKLPPSVAKKKYFMSMRFSHVSKDGGLVLLTRKNTYIEVFKGQVVALVGQSGNAGGTKPHVHLEVSVFDNKKEAMNDKHTLRNYKSGAWMGEFRKSFSKNCLTKRKMKSSRPLALGNRIDPYLLLNCLSKVPELEVKENQESKFYPGRYRWSYFYTRK
ncbi:MAG: hypothetical protein ISR65_01180 [Bacteriovoracaceae bacterium]|nr:hypothetical protein [Bacteriovoracaceae bacterium]